MATNEVTIPVVIPEGLSLGAPCRDTLTGMQGRVAAVTIDHGGIRMQVVSVTHPPVTATLPLARLQFLAPPEEQQELELMPEFTEAAAAPPPPPPVEAAPVSAPVPTQQPAPVPPPAPAPVPVNNTSFKDMEVFRAACTEVLTAGGGDASKVMPVFQSFGIAALEDLPITSRGAFLDAVKHAFGVA